MLCWLQKLLDVHTRMVPIPAISIESTAQQSATFAQLPKNHKCAPELNRIGVNGCIVSKPIIVAPASR